MASKRSRQTRAGKLLSRFIREIAEEETEMIVHPENGDVLVTKAEALGRLIWKKALGYTEKKIINGKPVEVQHNPDRYMIELLYTRMEGRAPIAVEDGDKNITIPEKISEQGKKRINETLDG